MTLSKILLLLLVCNKACTFKSIVLVNPRHKVTSYCLIRSDLWNQAIRIVPLQGFMKPEEVDMLINCTHKPNLVCNMISTIIRAGKLTQQEIFNMDQNLTLFSDTTGGSERIFKTPIPLSWTSKDFYCNPYPSISLSLRLSRHSLTLCESFWSCWVGCLTRCKSQSNCFDLALNAFA